MAAEYDAPRHLAVAISLSQGGQGRPTVPFVEIRGHDLLRRVGENLERLALELRPPAA